ncbi:hypothetical protein FACS189494_05200 [Spirochaetia bacterium]|nr:hypothetical protein FACS189494_05200 [Spirochaetia bacterium]
METVKIENWADIRELVEMSIGTDKGRWWADLNFGSDLRILRHEGKVTPKTAGIVARMLDQCLRWLKDDGLANDIVCTAEQTGKYEITYNVIITKPDGNTVIIKDVWNGIRER